MIVGNGLLARSFAPCFANNPDIVIFASGVSNSAETRSTEFLRERVLLETFLGTSSGPLVYFGSCGVDSPENTPYLTHKRAMESLVLESRLGMVLRLPQVVGVTPNPNTLTNFLRDRILAGQPFTVWSRAERNLMDIDDIVAIGASLIGLNPVNRIIAVAAQQSMPMPAIVAMFEHVLERRAIYTTEDKGAPLHIDSSTSVAVAEGLGIDLGPTYAEHIIRKYYAPTTSH